MPLLLVPRTKTKFPGIVTLISVAFANLPIVALSFKRVRLIVFSIFSLIVRFVSKEPDTTIEIIAPKTKTIENKIAIIKIPIISIFLLTIFTHSFFNNWKG